MGEKTTSHVGYPVFSLLHIPVGSSLQFICPPCMCWTGETGRPMVKVATASVVRDMPSNPLPYLQESLQETRLGVNAVVPRPAGAGLATKITLKTLVESVPDTPQISPPGENCQSTADTQLVRVCQSAAHKSELKLKI